MIVSSTSREDKNHPILEITMIIISGGWGGLAVIGRATLVLHISVIAASVEGLRRSPLTSQPHVLFTDHLSVHLPTYK